VNLAVHFIRARSPDTELPPDRSFYITLLVGVVRGKKRIVGGKGRN